MTADRLLARYDRVATVPYAIPRLRIYIFEPMTLCGQLEASITAGTETGSSLPGVPCRRHADVQGRPSDNRLVQLEERRFGDLNLNEREHLPEWLVHMPGAPGEDLLVIQKEFDGFEDTRERLDLLALDKEGRGNASTTSNGSG